MTCTCCCHEVEENHESDDCPCMRINRIPICTKCGIQLDYETELCEECFI